MKCSALIGCGGAAACDVPGGDWPAPGCSPALPESGSRGRGALPVVAAGQERDPGVRRPPEGLVSRRSSTGGREGGTRGHHGPAEPEHLLPVAAVPHRGCDRRVRKGAPARYGARGAAFAEKDAGGIEEGGSGTPAPRNGAGSVGQAGRTEPGFPPEDRELVAEPNATLGDWRELRACEQKKGRGRLRNEAPDGNEGSECQAGVEIMDTSLTSEFQNGTVGYSVRDKPPPRG